MKKILTGIILCVVVFAILLFALLSGHLPKGKNGEEVFVIGINQFSPPSEDYCAYEGIIDELKEAGISEETGSKIVLKYANGDQVVAFQINKQFVDSNVDLIVALGTVVAQTACKLTKTIPIVYLVLDAVKAGIADSLERPGGNKTGTSAEWAYEKMAELIRRLVPSAKKVGVPINPADGGAEAFMDHIRPLLKKHGMDVVEAPVASTAEVYGATKSLVGRCDAFLIAADHIVVSATNAVVKVANTNKIPLFSASPSSVERGAVASYGSTSYQKDRARSNYYQSGRVIGKIILQILKEKKDPGTIPVTVSTVGDLILNLKAARLQGVSIPEEILKEAAIKIE